MDYVDPIRSGNFYTPGVGEARGDDLSGLLVLFQLRA